MIRSSITMITQLISNCKGRMALKKNHIKSIFCVLIMLFFVQSAYAALYNPIQLKQFRTTGSCPGCNLANTTIGVNPGILAPYNLYRADLVNAAMMLPNAAHSDFETAIAIKTTFDMSPKYTTYSHASFQ